MYYFFNYRAHAFPAEIGTFMKSTLVNDKNTDVAVAPIKTTESTHSKF